MRTLPTLITACTAAAVVLTATPAASRHPATTTPDGPTPSSSAGTSRRTPRSSRASSISPTPTVLVRRRRGSRSSPPPPARPARRRRRRTRPSTTRPPTGSTTPTSSSSSAPRPTQSRSTPPSTTRATSTGRPRRRPEVVAELADATGVFFGGGDQMRYVRTLLDCAPAPDEAFTSCTDTPVLAALRAAADRGVVSGVSAGLTIQQGADMITGGESYEAWRDGSTPGYLDDPAELGYVPYGGFGFVEGVQLDSHFTTWPPGACRQARSRDRHDLVLGVDETTAVVLDRTTGVGRVIGEHGASLLDLGDARESGRRSDRRALELPHGRRQGEPRTRPRMAADGSAAVRPTTGPVAERADIWDSLAGEGGTYSLRDLARDAVASSARTASGTSLEEDPQFRTTLTRQPSTRAWTTPDGGVSFAGLERHRRAHRLIRTSPSGRHHRHPNASGRLGRRRSRVGSAHAFCPHDDAWSVRGSRRADRTPPRASRSARPCCRRT